MEEPIANRFAASDADERRAKGAQVDAGAKAILAERQVERPAGAVWIVAGRSTLTNELVVGALHERGVRAQFVEPARLSGLVRRDDVVLSRLDVRRTLDGVEDGIWELRRVEHRGHSRAQPGTFAHRLPRQAADRSQTRPAWSSASSDRARRLGRAATARRMPGRREASLRQVGSRRLAL
jgi:hypothetical protein